MKDKNKNWQNNFQMAEELIRKHLEKHNLKGNSYYFAWDSMMGIAEKPKKLPAKEASIVFYSIPKD